MKLSVKLLTCCVIAICVIWPTVEARRVILRPLSGREVRQVLRAAGREDAIPEGRSISSGLAVIKGVGLGIKKGVAGSILFDLATSNATMELISSLFNSTSGSSGTTQEICFMSRSVDGDQEQGRQSASSATGRGTTTGERAGTTTGGEGTTTGGTGGTTTTTGIVSPTPTSSTPPETSTNTETSITTPEPEPGMTCMVLTKPGKARKRRNLRNSRSARKYQHFRKLIHE